MAMASGLSLATSRQVTHHSFAQSFQRPFLRMQKTRRLSNLSRQLLASAAGVGAYGACHAMRQRRSFAVACAAEEATAPEAFPPAVIVGGGRLGEAFAKMGLRQDVIVRRGETFPSDAPEGPIYVCTRNDALEEVIRMVPEERHEDLVFVQNGVLMPFLDRQLRPGLPVTILLVYFAVAKKGEPPLDGKTDTDPEGLSAVNAGGKWAREVHWRLTSSDLACRILRDMEFKQAYWEKNLWISAYMMVDELIGQLAVAVSASQADVTWERLLLCDRLAAYARSVAHFPTAVKEFEWRNGAFYEMSKAAEAAGRPDPCLKHTEGLRTLKVI
ncbi:unnamed protein product [Durusdinium trenchii]|uniref:Ketopantoate reductase N-terminal domain-containing protein n=1 Tax=Durusdinium trenchii TaxID=1381693 RepID=A0ABP0QG52_9DINO